MRLVNRYEARIHQISLPLSAFITNYRHYLLAFFSILSLWLGGNALSLRLDPGFEKSIPLTHEYMSVYRDYSPMFGGANSIDFAIMRKSGTIFDNGFLQKVNAITREIRTINGVNPASVLSIFSPQAVFVTVDEKGFVGGRIVPANYAGTAEHIAIVKRNILLSDEIGKLVSSDLTGALIRAEIVPGSATSNAINYQAINRQLELLRVRFENDDTSVHIIGFTTFISEIVSGAKSVVLFFLIALLITAVLLFWFLRSFLLTSAAIFVALLSVVWELGIVNLLGLGIDPLSILVPFLIFSIASSHAVQMTNTWRQQVLAGGSSIHAAQQAFQRLFVPGTTALLGNAVGFAVIMLIDIPSIHILGIVAAIGVAVMIVTNKFLLPAMLSYITMSPAWINKSHLRKTHVQASRGWGLVAKCATKNWAPPILAVAAILLAVGLAARQHMIIGDVDRGAPELKPTARYNQDVTVITNKFKVGIDELTVIAKGPADSCSDFSAIYQIDRFHAKVTTIDGVRSVGSLAGLVRGRYVGNSEGFPKFYEIPRDSHTLGSTQRGIEIGQRIFNEDCSAIPVRIFLTDHRAETLEHVISAAKEYIAQDNFGPMRLLLATGSAGIMAAVNEAVQAAQGRMLVALYIGVGFLCLLTFASVRATLCVLLPLILVSQFAEAIMAWLGIGLKVATLPVVALGAGVGVDYGIYLFSRLQSGIHEGYSLKDAYFLALTQVGGAIVFTAITMSIGVATWAFSPLKFQADMGLLLTYMFFVNMVVALILVPALAAFLMPRTLSGAATPANDCKTSIGI